jgi:hypothetical protein
LLAGLVLTLALLAVSSDLHKRLHGGEPRHAHDAGPDNDAGCVVQLFAHGVTTPLALLSVVPPVANWTEIPAIIQPRLYLSAPRYLHQPERGPPLIG